MTVPAVVTEQRTREAARTATVRARPTGPLRAEVLGVVPYRTAWAMQRGLVARHHADAAAPDTVLLVEHPAVYTLGRRADPSNVLLSPDVLAERGIDVVAVDRGGDVTFHGPGQLVVYPVLRLARSRGVVDYVRTLEAIVLEVLAALDVEGERVAGRSGVWVGGAKVAAVGVRVDAGGVTSHGLALNVDPDLTLVDGIVPCGIRDAGVTSLARLGLEVDVPTVTDLTLTALAHVLGPLELAR